MALVQPGALQYWVPEWEGRARIWPLSGMIEVHIPNQPVANPQKRIWVQLTWEPQAVGNTPFVWEKDFGFQSSLIRETPLEGNWLHSTYSIILPF